MRGLRLSPCNGGIPWSGTLKGLATESLAATGALIIVHSFARNSGIVILLVWDGGPTGEEDSGRLRAALFRSRHSSIRPGGHCGAVACVSSYLVGIRPSPGPVTQPAPFGDPTPLVNSVLSSCASSTWTRKSRHRARGRGDQGSHGRQERHLCSRERPRLRCQRAARGHPDPKEGPEGAGRGGVAARRLPSGTGDRPATNREGGVIKAVRASGPPFPLVHPARNSGLPILLAVRST